MNIFILHKNPVKSAQMLPDKMKFKMLIELAQMVSTLTGSVFKPVKQGKELVHWIDEHRIWVKYYMHALIMWCKEHVNLKPETLEKLTKIYYSLENDNNYDIEYGVFRYKEGYKTNYVNNSILPIDVLCDEYVKYIEDFKGYDVERA